MLFWNDQMFYAGQIFIGFFLNQCTQKKFVFRSFFCKISIKISEIFLFWTFLKFSNFDQPKTDAIFLVHFDVFWCDYQV